MQQQSKSYLSFFQSELGLAILLVLVLIMGSNYRSGIINHKHLLTHDESISTLAYAASEGAFNELTQRSSFSAGEVKQLQQSGSSNLQEVAEDLFRNDIHPPLYFYFYGHLNQALTNGYASLVRFNLIIQLLSLVFVFLIARMYLSNYLALLSVFMWYVSPAVFQNYFELRHYPLFELFAFAYMYFGLTWVRKPQSVRFALAALLSFFLLALTHFYALLVLASLMALLLVKKEWRLILFSGFAHLAVYGVILVLFAEYFDPIISSISGGDSTAIVKKPSYGHNLLVSLVQLAKFFAYQFWLIGAFLALIAGYVALNAKVCIARLSRISDLLVVFAALLLQTLVIYVLGIAPEQAVGFEYYFYLWPLLAIVLVQLFESKPFISFACSVIMAVGAIHGTATDSRYIDSLSPQLSAALAKAETLEVSSFARGYIPRLALHLPNDCQIILKPHAENTKDWFASINGSKAQSETVEYITFQFAE